MANKNCTPSLIKKARKGTSFFRSLFKKGQTDNGFYTAVSHDGRTTLWWIEANQLGKTSCYPCVIYQDGEEHAFVSGRSNKEKASNKELMEKWNEAVTPENIDELYTVTEMKPDEFFRQFNPAEDRQMKKLFYPKPKAEEAADASESEADVSEDSQEQKPCEEVKTDEESQK